MTLRVVALTAMVACSIGVSACGAGTPHDPPQTPEPTPSGPPPVTGVVDRVTPFGPSRDYGVGSFFTLEGDISMTYVCFGSDYTTLQNGDRITFDVTISSEGKLNQVQNLQYTPR